MQREERRTPPPPYTLVDHQFNNNNNNNSSSNNNNSNNNNNHNAQQQQYHSQNPYPATVLPPDADFRLAQKLQDEEYARWAESDPQQEFHPTRSGECSASTHFLPRAPMPPIPEHYQYNHYQSYQNQPYNGQPCQTQQCAVVYASPNQPPLPYSQASPYANNSEGGQPYYGSLGHQGYYQSQSHPFFNAPPYQQIPQRQYRNTEEEDDTSSCLSGLYDRFFILSIFAIIILYILNYYYDDLID